MQFGEDTPVPSCSRNAFSVFYTMKMCRWVSAEMLRFVCRRGDSWVLSTSGSNGTALKDLRPCQTYIFFFFFFVSAQSLLHFTLFRSRDCWEPVTPSRPTACKTYPWSSHQHSSRASRPERFTKITRLVLSERGAPYFGLQALEGARLSRLCWMDGPMCYPDQG